MTAKTLCSVRASASVGCTVGVLVLLENVTLLCPRPVTHFFAQPVLRKSMIIIASQQADIASLCKRVSVLMDEVHVLKSSVATLQEKLQHGDSDDTSDSTHADQGVKGKKGRGKQPRVPNSVADTNHTKPPSQVGKGKKNKCSCGKCEENLGHHEVCYSSNCFKCH